MANTVNGGGIVRLTPITKTSGELASMGTPIDFLATNNEKPKRANFRLETEYFEWETATEVNMKIAKNKTAYDVAAAASTSVGDSKDSFTFDALLTAAQKTSLRTIWASTDSPVLVSFADGRAADSTRAVQGWSHLLGYATGDLEDNNSPGLNPATITVTGGTAFTAASGFDETDVNAVQTGASNTITPTNGSAETIKALVSADMTAILTGKIRDTAAS